MKKITLLFLTIILAINPIPTAKAHSGSETSKLALSSGAAILMEADSGQILYEKNSDETMYPASLTKIATAIYVIDTADLDEIVTVSRNASRTDGTSVFLEEGEQVTLRKLLQGLLINSGNDAGVAIAEHVSGSVEQFSSEMTSYFSDLLGTVNTNFENPHGLFDPDHVTTAEELAKITQYAMKDAVFSEIFGTRELNWDGETWDTTLLNHHKLVKEEIPYEGITGGKNGYVGQSGFTLATTSERDNLSLIAVTLKSNLQEESYEDTIKLLDYGFDQFKTSTIPKGQTFLAGEHKFTNPKKIAYTHQVDEKVVKKVTEKGKLEVINQDGKITTSFTLNEVQKEKGIAHAKASTQKDTSNLRSILTNMLPNLAYFVIAIVLILGIFFRRIRKV